MIKFLNGRNAQSEIVSSIINSSETVRLAVAYWGNGAARRLLTRDPDCFTIICNLESGGCNPNEIETIYKSGISIYTNRNLHAKMYIGQGIVAIGSSNASSNGIWEEGASAEGMHEANLITSDERIVSECGRYFEILLKDSHTKKITLTDIDNARRTYQKKMLSRRRSCNEICDISRAKQHELAGFYLGIWEEKICPNIIDAARNYREKRGEDTSRHDIFQFREDPGGPTGSLIFSAKLNRNKSALTVDGWYEYRGSAKIKHKLTQMCDELNFEPFRVSARSLDCIQSFVTSYPASVGKFIDMDKIPFR